MSGREPTPRITPGGVRDIGLLNSVLVRALGVAARTGPPNLFTTLARHRSLFRRWLVFASGLMPGGRLPRADTELIILRVAHLCDCPYERLHHERLGREAGLSDAAVAATERPLDDGPWSARQRALLGATDALHRARRLDDASWDALQAHLDEPSLIELCFLVGHYEMVAMVLNSLRIALDARPRAR